MKMKGHGEAANGHGSNSIKPNPKVINGYDATSVAHPRAMVSKAAKMSKMSSKARY
jgi:hypothetical protein